MTDTIERSSCQGLVGKVIEGLYPRHNFVGVPLTLERRRLRVDEVRDTEADPLDPLTLALNPLLNRGRVLLKGLDLDKGEGRAMYLERFAELRILADHEAECTEAAELERPATVVIVDQPEGWQPRTVEDLPPGVERHHEPSPVAAIEFARRFNALQMEESTGHWAVA